MAAKRFFSDSGSDPAQPPNKQMRTRPTFASVIGEVVMVNSLQHFCKALEPMLRRVVNEEVERGLMRCTRSITRVPSVRIQALEPSNLHLKFSQKLHIPIFTGSKIVDVDGSPLQIHVVDGDQNLPVPVPGPIKVEIVVLDGDFPPGDCSNWNPQEFDGSIQKERSGKRPLLAGDINITMRNASATVGDIELTDNSSWIRSRKFRLGARVVPGSYQGARIHEAVTEAFVVKDHRGESYKKHFPPSLDDDVWRLVKIGKDGAFHKKLASMGIKTVKDFLKMSVIDTAGLRGALGPGMSEKTWEATIKHARTCEMGNKHYVYTEGHCTIIMNPICQVERAVINGHTYSTRELWSSTVNKTYIENLVRKAHLNWSTLHEFEGLVNDTALLTQGEVEDQYPQRNEVSADRVLQFQHGGFQSDSALFEVGYSPLPSSYNSNNNHVPDLGTNDWQMAFVTTPGEHVISYSITEASSDGDLTPRSFITGS